MKFARLSSAAIVLAIMGSIGCTKTTPDAVATDNSSGASSYRLASEPAGVLDVKEARTSAGDGDVVAVVGRIGGDAAPRHGVVPIA